MAATTDATRTDRGVAHPLDPLTTDEIARTVAILREGRGLGDEARFVDISLREPEKDELARHEAGEPIPREAAVVVADRTAQTTHEAVVSLDDGAIGTWDTVPGVQAAITLDEYVECEQAVRADPRFREALARRGISEPENVMAEAWSLGGHAEPGEQGRRLAWTPCWYRESLADNAYARPIEGLYTVVDLNTMEVLRVEDTSDVPVPEASGAYRRGPGRPASRRCAAARGRPARGPELRGRGPRGAVAEVAVPGRLHAARGARPAHDLLPRPGSVAADRAPGVVCRARHPLRRPEPGPLPHERLRHRRVRHRPDDELARAGLRLPRRDPLPRRRRPRQPWRAHHDRATRSACTRRTYGLLWKHYDWQAEDSEVRRSRRFVISSIITAANYEYAFYWYLYQDGTIETEVKLTGIVLTSAVHPGEKPALRPPREPRPLGAEPPALLLRPARHGRRRPPNDVHEVHTESRPGRPREPLRKRVQGRRDPALERARRAAADRPAVGSLLADLEPRPAKHGRRPRRLQARPGIERAAVRRRGLERPGARRVRDEAPVGDALRAA